MWIPISSQTQQTIPFKVSSTALSLQDEYINLDELTVLKDATVFSIEKQAALPYEKDLNVQIDLTVEMNLDQKVVFRGVYSVLDYLSDVGGIQAMLISGVAYFLSLWNYNMLDNHMVSRLYKLKKPEHENVAKSNGESKNWNDYADFV